MAYASWLNVDPTKGSGNGSVNVGTEEYTGRSARSTVITFSADGCSSVEKTVNQTGASEYVEVDSTSIAVAKEGETVNISGTSNSKAISYEITYTDIEGLTLPDSYTAAGITTANGADIADDPGSASAFEYSMSIAIPENTTTEARKVQITFTDENGNKATVEITQAAGEAYLRVTEPTGDITLDYTGAVVAVKVESNTNWTVE